MLSMSHRAPGIPVEQPCPADVFGHLEHARAHAEFPQPVQRIEAGESGADDDRVEAGRTGRDHDSAPHVRCS